MIKKQGFSFLDFIIILLIISIAGVILIPKDLILSKLKGKTKENSKNETSSSATKILTISYTGQSVSLDDFVVKEGVTIFDFYADWCGPCKQLGPQLENYVNNTKNVFLRKLNIQTWSSPVAKQYQISSIPSIWIYNKSGNLQQKGINGMENIKNEVEKLL